MVAVGESVLRKEALDKVTGAVKYNDDIMFPGLLHAALVTSLYAHAGIKPVDTAAALAIPGVLAVVTGYDTQLRCGEVLEDRPALARDKVRYFGEPIAVVVAESEAAAMRGVAAIYVEYTPLPVVNSPRHALDPASPLVHENPAGYKIAKPPVYPQPGTNIADQIKVRKGDMAKGWAASEVVVEANFALPQVEHAAMETRSVKAEILPDGRVMIHTTSQAPFEVQKLIARYFSLEEGNVIVQTPLLGGAFGGKTAVQLEVIAYLASQAVGGRLVKLANPREQDMRTSPVGMGLDARVKLGATRQGKLMAAELTFWIDAGAYTDSAPRVARAVASDCSGPYNIENLWCDSYCVLTNHTYTTAFRGFGHGPCMTAIERTMDKLAFELGIDPLELRAINAVRPGDLTPTRVRMTRSNLGDLPQCIERLKALIRWDEGARIQTSPHTVRAKGVSCFWKTSTSPPNAISGVILSLNADGSINLNCGAVEMGAATKTTAAQILAERLQMDVAKIHVHMEVSTQTDPEHWKSVASMGTFMVGRAVLEAAEDIIRQLKSIAGVALRCGPEDLDVAGERVFLRDDPETFLAFKDIAHGYKYVEGHAVGGQIMGKGSFIMRHLTPMDPETGQGRTGPAWTVAAQGVEVELDTRTWMYKILTAATVLDAGKVINPKAAEGVVMGGMCMGLGYGSRECVMYDDAAEFVNAQLRTYKVMRYGEQPEYRVEFVETPQIDAPYGARPVGEHGVIGMPAALANALSSAAGVDLHELPLTPQRIWEAVGGASRGPA